MEAELLVVIRAEPFDGVDRAAFQRRIEVAAGQLLRHAADAREDGAAEAGDPHLEALQILDGLDLLAEPAAHLGAGVPIGKLYALYWRNSSFSRSIPPPSYIQAFCCRVFMPKGTPVAKAKAGFLPM